MVKEFYEENNRYHWVYQALQEQLPAWVGLAFRGWLVGGLFSEHDNTYSGETQ